MLNSCLNPSSQNPVDDLDCKWIIGAIEIGFSLSSSCVHAVRGYTLEDTSDPCASRQAAAVQVKLAILDLVGERPGVLGTVTP